MVSNVVLGGCIKELNKYTACASSGKPIVSACSECVVGVPYVQVVTIL